jgi:hypothetical protein
MTPPPPRPAPLPRRSRVHLSAGRLRARAQADLPARRHQPARGQAGHGLQPPVAPPARDRPPLFASYLQWLESRQRRRGRAEWQEFVNCLTTNLTSFFREEHHFHALVDDLRAAPRPAAHLVQRRLHRRGALLAGDDGGRDAGRRRRCASCAATSTPRCWPPPRAASTRRRPRPEPRAAARHFLRGTGSQRRLHPRQARAGAADRVPPVQPDEPRWSPWASPSTSCSAAT